MRFAHCESVNFNGSIRMIHISNLNKTFGSSKGLSHINLHVAPGEMVALIGSSGSGKSTLMRHICGLTAADKGESLVRVDNEIVQKNGCISRDIRRIRTGIGMIFQQFNLVERMSVARNVMLGALARTSLWRSLTGAFHTDDRELALRALARVGIGEKAWQRTGTISGGQQQRAAIARALVQRARVLLADEPIASLDPLTLIADFFPPDFTDWRMYVEEMIVTLHVAIWGTLLAVICAVPLGIMSSENIAP